MNEQKLTEKIDGYFDVREFEPNSEYAKRKMKPDGNQISFTWITDAEPIEFKEFMRVYQSKSGETRWAVTFKISSKCRFFNAAAEQMQRPTNEELDMGRYEVRIYYSVLRGDASRHEAYGYWANAIQLYGVVSNPFLQQPEAGTGAGESAEAARARIMAEVEKQKSIINENKMPNAPLKSLREKEAMNNEKYTKRIEQTINELEQEGKVLHREKTSKPMIQSELDDLPF